MFKRTALALAFATALHTAAWAQTQACAPEKLGAAIDAYAEQPFSATAWRKINGLGDPGIQPDNSASMPWAANDEWRKRVAEIAPNMTGVADVGYDCRLRYPLDVLNARVAQFGKDSAYVQGWLRGQERVIAACAGRAVPEKLVVPPGTLKPDEEKLMADDAAYQDASVAFYLDKPAAVQAFRAIGASASSHKAAARYNVANLLANGKDLAGAQAEAKAILADPSLASVHDITRELVGYIANLEDTPQGWSALLTQTMAELNKPLAEITANDASRARYAAALYDASFIGLAEKRDDWFVTNTLPADATLSKALADGARAEPLALWMMTGQTVAAPYDRAPWSMVGPKWKAWAASFIDRAKALQPAGGKLSPLATQMLDALKAGDDEASRAAMWKAAADAAAKAKDSCGDAPETGAVALFTETAARLSVQAGTFDEIAAQLNALPLQANSALRTSVARRVMQSALATGKVEEGRRLRDALGLASVAGTIDATNDYAGNRAAISSYLRWLAEDRTQWLAGNALAPEKLAAPELNLLPAKALRELADDTGFSASQRALLARAAFTRNYARGIGQSAETLDKMLAANPQIKTSYDAVRTEFPKLKPERALLLTILRNPRFGILVNSPDWTEPIEADRTDFAETDYYDHNDKNWWCPMNLDRTIGDLKADYDEATGVAGVRDYNKDRLQHVLEADALAKADTARDAVIRQNALVRAADWKEAQALAKAPSAPRMLSAQALRWAKASKGDDGAAEALALAVRTTRYGCSWAGGHKAYSKPAQELLQAKFGKSPWAAKTPYWFDCMDRTWNEKTTNMETTCAVRTWPKQALPR